MQKGLLKLSLRKDQYGLFFPNNYLFIRVSSLLAFTQNMIVNNLQTTDCFYFSQQKLEHSLVSTRWYETLQ